MRRSGAFVIAVLLLVVAPACSEHSRVDPNARVHVTGGVVDPSGAPLAGRPVHLGAGITDSDVGLAIFTVGLSCATVGCRGKQFDTSTDGTGAYSFTLKGSDSQSTFGEAVNELVTASAAPGPHDVSGASVSARFRIQTTEVQLPVLHLVDPGLRVTRDDGGIEATWSTAAPGPYELTFENGDAGPVWRVMTADSASTVDPRVVEDTNGRVVLGGAAQDRIEGSAVDLHWRSPGVGYAGVGAPPSRGRPCTFVDATGALLPASGGCSLTDGQLSRATGAPPQGAAAADVSLAQPVPATLVVVRGCASSCDVAVTSDGTTFTTAGTATGDDAVVALDGTPIKGVRVGLGSSPSQLREVSVWGPAPSPAAAPDVGDLRHRFGSATSASHVPVLLVVLAAVLAAAVLVGLGIVIGRRRVRAGAVR